jgi:signal transduction histidine kinase
MNTAMQSLREITRGVFPAQLTRSGLHTALGSLLARPDLTGHLTVEDSAAGLRFDPRVEAAAYFCVAEATRAFDPPIAVTLSVHGDQLQLHMSGIESGGLSLRHMRDRIEATGGSVTTTDGDGRTIVEVRAPAARTPDGPKSAQTAEGSTYLDAAVQTSWSRSGPNADFVK